MGNSSISLGSTCPDLVPGLPDPLPELSLRPVPLDWPCREEVRNKHIKALRFLLCCDIPQPRDACGWGIVTCGGGIYWPGIVVSVRMLRMVSNLPVQIWYRGGEEGVVPEDLAGVEGVTLIDATTFFNPPPRILGGWQLKTLGLLNCGFERALFLDGDAYLLSAPEVLFSLLDQSRLIYWRDLDHHWQNVNWDWWGLDATKGGKPPPIQGGQLFIDLLTFRRELVIAHWLNQHSEYSYHFPPHKKSEWHGYGDQDMWRVALFATGGTHHSLGAAREVPEGLVCDLHGAPIVVHRTRAKICANGEASVAGNLPGDERVNAILREHLSRRERPELLFWGLFKSGAWGVPNSCGAGSSPEEAEPYLNMVNALIQQQGWQDVVDLGCGDGSVDAGIKCSTLHGVDVVYAHVSRLRRERPEGRWTCADICAERESLPVGDVALCKDVLHHWDNARVLAWIKWAWTCGKWKAVLYTQDCRQDHSGEDCFLGGYRALDPSMSPLLGLNLFLLGKFLHKAVLLQMLPPPGL